MSEFIQGADAIRNFARQFKQLIAVADALESVGSLDQAKAEREASIKSLTVLVDGCKAEAEAACAITQRVKDDAVLVAQKGHEEAERILAAANDNAASVAAAAATSADAVKRGAEASAATMIANAKEIAATFRSEADMLHAKGLSLQREIDGQEAELTRLTDAIAAARATLAQMMGDEIQAARES